MSALAFSPAAAVAQIIDDTTELVAPAPNSRVRFQLFTDARYATNALAASNLPGGFEEPAVDDIIWVKGAAVTLSQNISAAASVFASGAAFHANFFDNKALNFIGLRGIVGIEVRPSQRTSIFLAGSCASEFNENGLRSYYRYCGPIAGLAARVGPDNRAHLDIGITGTLAMGKAETFARYREAQAFIRFETGGRVRFSIEPSALIRDHSLPDGLPAGLDLKRTDYRGRVEVGLRYVGRHIEAGVTAEPAVNWSSQDQFRYWDVRFGPTLKLRF